MGQGMIEWIDSTIGRATLSGHKVDDGNRRLETETAAGSKIQFEGVDADLDGLYWLATFLCPLFKVLKLPPNGDGAQNRPDD